MKSNNINGLLVFNGNKYTIYNKNNLCKIKILDIIMIILIIINMTVKMSKFQIIMIKLLNKIIKNF